MACRGWSATEWLGYGGAGPCSGAELAGRLRLSLVAVVGKDEAQGSAGPNKGRNRRFRRAGLGKAAERSSAGISGRLPERRGGKRRKGTGPTGGPRLQRGERGDARAVSGPCTGLATPGREGGAGLLALAWKKSGLG